MNNATQDSTLTNLTNSPSSPSTSQNLTVWTNEAKGKQTSSLESSDQISAMAAEIRSPDASFYAAEPTQSSDSFNTLHKSSPNYPSHPSKRLSLVETPWNDKRTPRDLTRSVYMTCPSTIGTIQDLNCDNIKVEVKLSQRSELDITSPQNESRISDEDCCPAPLNSENLWQPKQFAHFRSHSLNNIACLYRAEYRRNHNQSYHSSSSSDCFPRPIKIGLSYPLYPTCPPPEGCLTPPGLPSFGTTEAQELRLIPSSRPEWLDDLLKRLRKHAQAGDPEHSMEGQRVFFSSSSTRERADAPTDARDHLRRMLGFSRLVITPPDYKVSRRASLPPGVVVASFPGALARADDGSMVRGRFGYRASGHGVGPRSIEAHPWNRDNRSGEREQNDVYIGKSSQDHQAGVARNTAVSTTEARSSTNVNIQNTDVEEQQGSWESSSTARALNAERRALGALETERKENQRLRMALAAAQRGHPGSLSGLRPSEDYRHTNSRLSRSAVCNERGSNVNNTTTQPAILRLDSVRSHRGVIQRMREPSHYTERSHTASNDRNIVRGVETRQYQQHRRQQAEEKKASQSSCAVL